MTDLREEILDRLVVVAQGVSGITSVSRNRIKISDTSLPGIFIFDGNEQADSDDPIPRDPTMVRRVHMNPEIIIVVQDKTEDIGQELNTHRAALVKAILTDSTLKSLTLDQVGIRYGGCTTGLDQGRKIQGEMKVSISFTYQLKPSDL